MRSASKFTPIGALVLVALMVPAASASPLLSGYGGPGQGNQVILGSALLNSHSGGGGRGGSSGSGGSSSESADLAAPATPSSRSASSSEPRRPAAARKGRGRAPHAAATGATGDASNTAPAAYRALERGRGSRPLLGFSGSDLVYVVLGLGVLVLTGVLTSRLAGRQPAGRGGGSSGAAHVPTRK
jgi:hypothetical protein